jgi:hypothetical protein
MISPEQLVLKSATGLSPALGQPARRLANPPGIRGIIKIEGIKGMHPLGCLPLWGRVGVTLTGSRECE